MKALQNSPWIRTSAFNVTARTRRVGTPRLSHSFHCAMSIEERNESLRQIEVFESRFTLLVQEYESLLDSVLVFIHSFT